MAAYGDVCAICLDKRGAMCIVNCNQVQPHRYHFKCLSDWCNAKPSAACTCPACRQPITAITCAGVTHSLIRISPEDLRIAISDNNLARVNELIAAGANVNAADMYGRTGLMMAHDLGIVQALLAAGANVNAADVRGRTALMMASNLEILQALLAAGANVNAVNNNGLNALMTGIKGGVPLWFVSELLAAQIDVDHADNEGQTALMYVANDYDDEYRDRAIKIAIALLNAGADPKLKDMEGETALDMLPRNVPLYRLIQEAGLRRSKRKRSALEGGRSALLAALLYTKKSEAAR